MPESGDDRPDGPGAVRPTVSRRGALLAGVGATAGIALAACGGRPSAAGPQSPTSGTGTAVTGSAVPSSAVGSTALSPSGGAAAGGGSAAGPVLQFIRHAEKPAASGAPFGVLPDGTQDAESLIVAGWNRAGALVELFDPGTADGPVAPRSGLARPDQIVAADPSKGSRRPAQTVGPLADRLGMTVETTWKKADTAPLAQSLLTRHGVVLISWEHELIPEILSHLGSIDPAPPAQWPDDRFDLVWCLHPTGDGSWAFTQVPQLLLAGDSSTAA